MTQPFLEIYVDHMPRGGSIVYWGLRRDFCDEGPYTFQLQWAESVEADFIDAGDPVVNQFFTTDTLRRVWAKSIESYYRVTLTTAEGVYTSFPQQANGVWNKRDWLLARDIMRKERLLMRKFTGWEGNLLKRKVWGEVCPDCADWDTREVSAGKCMTCFGTGKVGGYWAGYETWAYEMQAGPQQRNKTWPDDATYIHEDQTLQMRMSAYPHLATYDVFVENDSGRRYVIRNIAVAAEIRGIPLINIVEMRLAPTTDIVYDVPVAPNPVGPDTGLEQPHACVDPVFPEPAPEPEPEPDPEPTESDDFLEHPIETPPIDIEEEVVEPEPEPEVEEEVELVIPVGPNLAIWYEQSIGEWYLGATVGDEATALYRTTDGQMNPYFLDSYTWEPINHSGTMTVAAGDDPSIYVVTSSMAGVAGDYRMSGTYGPTFVYLKG